MRGARRAVASDLAALLDLFRRSEVSAVAEAPGRIWAEMPAREGVSVFVSEAGGDLGATCLLVTVPNLLRAGRAHGFLENVVTDPAHRGQGHGQGHGRAVVGAALAQAWAEGCHHVLLQTGRTDPRVHRFYAGCGFRPGVRTGYVATRPG